MKQLTREEKISEIYEKISPLESCLMLTHILEWLYNQQKWEWVMFFEQQFEQIILELLDLYEKKTIWINQQPDECINFIHSLLEQWQK